MRETDGDGAAAFARRLAWGIAACQVAFVWLMAHPVGTDLPAHYTVLAGLTHREDLGLDRYLEYRWFPSPYMLTSGLFLLFGSFADWETAARCVLTLYFTLLPACVLYWIRSFSDTDDTKILFASAFSVTNTVLGGNYHSLFGLMTLLVVLGYWFRTAGAPSVRRILLLALGMLAVYFHHFAVFAAGIFCQAVLSVFHSGRRRLLLEAVLCTLLPAAFYLKFAHDLGGMPALAGDFHWTHLEAVYHRLAFPFGGFGFWGDLLTQLPTVLACLALAAFGVFRERRARSLALALAGIGILVLVLPARGHYHMLGTRLVSLMLFLCLPLLARPRGIWLTAVAVGAVFWNAYVGLNVCRLQKPVGEYIAFLDRIPPDQPVFPLFGKLDAESRGSRIHDFHSKLVNHYHIRKGGVSPHLIDIIQGPWEGYLRYKDPRYKSDALAVDQFDIARYAPLYPYVVYKGSEAGLQPLFPVYRVREREKDLFLLERPGE